MGTNGYFECIYYIYISYVYYYIFIVYIYILIIIITLVGGVPIFFIGTAVLKARNSMRITGGSEPPAPISAVIGAHFAEIHGCTSKISRCIGKLMLRVN